MLSASSAAAASLGLPQPGTLPGDPFGLLVDTARTWLTGKKRTFRFPEGDLTMVLDRHLGAGVRRRPVHRPVRPGPHPGPGRRMGRLPVRADGDKVKNVHLRPGTRPVLVASPVLCEGFMPAEAASRWLATVSPQLELVLHDGVPQVGVIGAPWARLEVETGAEGRSVQSARAPCAWATCAWPCGPRPSACPCPRCPAGP